MKQSISAQKLSFQANISYNIYNVSYINSPWAAPNQHLYPSFFLNFFCQQNYYSSFDDEQIEMTDYRDWSIF